MRLLIVKMSSLGDVIHMLPALSDARAALPELRVDWVVERAFAPIPSWHPGVSRVIPIALREWRKRPLARRTREELWAFGAALRAHPYHRVVDAQGLLKSALVSTWARGPAWGFDRHSAREPLAAGCYHRGVSVSPSLHAVSACRRLLADVLGYALPQQGPSYGLVLNPDAEGPRLPERYVLGLHGTSRPEKEWPEEQWVAFGKRLTRAALLLPWATERERERALRIASQIPLGYVLPALDLAGMARVITRSLAVVGVDTGLMHLAAALKRPGLALYTASDPLLTGVLTDREAPIPIVNLGPRDGLSAERVFSRLALGA